MLITIDPGHWPTGNQYPPAPKFYEGTQMWKLGQYLKAELVKHGFSVVNTRPAIDDNPSVGERGLIAAKNKSILLVSLHSNAVGDVSGKHDVTGTEVYYSIKGSQHSALASKLASSVAGIMGHHSRGFKTMRSTTDPTSDYFGVIRAAANNGCTCVMLIEHGFHTNKKDALFLSDDSNLRKLALAEANIIADYFHMHKPSPSDPMPVTGATPILSPPTASSAQARAWAASRQGTDQFIALASIYWNLAKIAGVNPVAAYCQSAKETNFGRFGGRLDASYYNPCGLKVKLGNADSDENAHHRFKEWNEGIKAHIDHLALYAGAPEYPKQESDTPDPRHFQSIYGCSKTIEGLGAYWSFSPTYGKEIVAMMNALTQTAVPEGDDPAKARAIEITLQNALEDEVITSITYWQNVLLGKQDANPDYIKLMMDRYHTKLKAGEHKC